MLYVQVATVTEESCEGKVESRGSFIKGLLLRPLALVLPPEMLFRTPCVLASLCWAGSQSAVDLSGGPAS